VRLGKFRSIYFVLATQCCIINHYSRWVSLNPQIFFKTLGNTIIPVNRRNGFLFWSSSALMQHKPLPRFLWFSRSSRGHQHCRMMDGWMVGWLAGHKARNPPGFSAAYFLPFRCMHFNFMFTTQNYTGRNAGRDFQLQTLYRVWFAFVSVVFSVNSVFGTLGKSFFSYFAGKTSVNILTSFS
jgi:hypothetical protein